MKQEDWVWMPHPGHFICARDCRFHLSTYVGGYIVSTVGEYEPSMEVREILAKSRGMTLEGKGDARRADAFKKLGWEEIGCDRTYETMVFKAEPSKDGPGSCCPYRMVDAHDVAFAGYNSPDEAYRGHMELCREWAQVSSPDDTTEVK